MPNPAVQLLLARQGQDGGWGAYADFASRTESTALASLALERHRVIEQDPAVGPAAAAGAEWLLARQLASGAWPMADDVPGPSWTTGLASLALSHFGSTPEPALAGAAWLLEQRGRGSPWWVRLLYRLAPSRKAVELDLGLVGWSWVDGTFSWVEPTAYAVLALKRLRPRLPVGPTGERIGQAELLFADRVCSDGGWNYGNTRIFGEALWSYPDTTALVLLALADQTGESLVEEGLAALDGLAAENGSVLSLGLTAVARRTHGRDSSDVRARLEARLQDWRDGETRALAWAALGLLDVNDPLGLRP